MAKKQFTQKDLDNFALTYQLYSKLLARARLLKPHARTRMEVWIEKRFDVQRFFTVAQNMAKDSGIPFKRFLDLMEIHRPGQKARGGLGGPLIAALVISMIAISLSVSTATLIVAYNMSKGDRLQIQEAHVDELKRMMAAGEISQLEFNIQMGKIAAGAALNWIPWWAWVAGGAVLVAYGLPAGRKQYVQVSERWKTARSRRKIKRAEEKLATLQEGAYEPA